MLFYVVPRGLIAVAVVLPQSQLIVVNVLSLITPEPRAQSDFSLFSLRLVVNLWSGPLCWANCFNHQCGFLLINFSTGGGISVGLTEEVDLAVFHAADVGYWS